ncbi:MAG: carboxypeptidase-like regulatory domain-containing protein, partial [Bacteroidota bacterium]
MKPFYQVLTIKLLCLVFALSLPEFGFAQSMANARVVDANTDEPLPYATIADLSGSRGTLSNADGVFALEIKNPTDTISISFLGYQTAILSAEELLTLNEIRLTPEVTQLTDVIVTADDDYLYQIINQCRASVKDAPIEWSRAFLQHVTRSNDHPIEMIQAYYNVSSSQKAIDDLILKNGRVAMAPINGRYFVNLG